MRQATFTESFETYLANNPEQLSEETLRVLRFVSRRESLMKALEDIADDELGGWRSVDYEKVVGLILDILKQWRVL